MSDPQLGDVLYLLAQRSDLLGCLRAGIQDKRELEETLGISRSTLNRALNDLEDKHLVMDQADKLAVTAGGNAAHQIVQMCEPLSNMLPLLRYLPPDIRLDPALFRDATVIEADQPNPGAPIDHLETLIKTGMQVKGMSPVMFSRYIQLFHPQIIEQDINADIVLSKDCVEYLSLEYYDMLRDVVGTEHSTFWRIRDPPPFGLTIIDDAQVWLGIHTDDGNVKGAIINNSDDAVEWSLNIYQRFREEGKEVLL